MKIKRAFADGGDKSSSACGASRTDVRQPALISERSTSLVGPFQGKDAIDEIRLIPRSRTARFT